jgi:GT2 family glycosyltransferase
MPPKLSILIPTIRSEQLADVYTSVIGSCSESFEIIFVGPYPLPEFFKDKPNVKFIQDWGQPTRCRQMALLAAEGEYINFAADDVRFLPGALDEGFKILANNPDVVVIGKYLEGANPAAIMSDDWYYVLQNHDAIKHQTKWFPRYYLFNTGLIKRQALLDIGGWDCKFEACAMACVDLSIRIQNKGLRCCIQQAPMFKSSHLPQYEGDHAPIHNGQTEHDEPLFQGMYSTPSCVNRMDIPVDNWKDSPAYWERRFGKRG